MAVTKQKKEVLLSKAQDIFANNATTVFVEAKGMLVNDINTLRKTLKGEGVGYKVIKKTLVKKALSTTKTTGEFPEVLGELSLAYSTDLTTPARLVRDFEKKFKGKITILGGVFDGVYMDKAAMTEIAEIPGMDVLRGRFVNIINSPIQRVVIALDKIAEKKA